MRKVKEWLAFSRGSPGGLLWLLKWLVVTLLVLFVLLVLIAPEKAFTREFSDDALSAVGRTVVRSAGCTDDKDFLQQRFCQFL